MKNSNSLSVTGTTVNKRYTILRVLGVGAQGMVCEVDDVFRPGLAIALKAIPTRSPGAVLRFEYEQLAKLDHPHIVRVFELDTVNMTQRSGGLPHGTPFFTQELIRGASADTWVRELSQGQLADRVSRLGVAVARALGLLHSRGLLHRDVKPSNILVGGGGRYHKAHRFRSVQTDSILGWPADRHPRIYGPGGPGRISGRTL